MKGQTEEEDKKSPCASLKTIKDIKPFQNKTEHETQNTTQNNQTNK